MHELTGWSPYFLLRYYVGKDRLRLVEWTAMHVTWTLLQAEKSLLKLLFNQRRSKMRGQSYLFFPAGNVDALIRYTFIAFRYLRETYSFNCVASREII